MYGVDDMYTAVRSITELPHLVINSHGHFDHIGGDAQFDIVFLSALDFPILQSYKREQLNR